MITLDDLADLPIWGSWRDQNGVKVPYTIDGRRASTTNPRDWSTRAEAARYRRSGEQEAVNLTETPDGCLCGVDLDSCRVSKQMRLNHGRNRSSASLQHMPRSAQAGLV